MTNESSQHVESGPSRSRRNLAVALLLILLTAVWLAWTARQRGDEQQFFGLWRSRHLLPALAAIWLASAFLVATLSRKALFKWLAISLSACLTLAVIEVAGDVGLINASRLQ